MNKLFVGISCLPFTALNPRFESHFHAGDNIYDTAPSGYNKYTEMYGQQNVKKKEKLTHLLGLYTHIHRIQNL